MDGTDKTKGSVNQERTQLTLSISKENNWIAPTYRYSFKQKDVDIYSAKEFVHAYLDDGANQVAVGQQLGRITGVASAHFVSKETALKMIEAGAGRIGTSSGIKIVE